VVGEAGTLDLLLVREFFIVSHYEKKHRAISDKSKCAEKCVETLLAPVVADEQQDELLVMDTKLPSYSLPVCFAE
jgi:hypothetical protein